VQLHNAFSDQNDAMDADDVNYLPNPEEQRRGRETSETNRTAAHGDMLDALARHMFGE
jgi:hypothetical protein